MTEDRWLEKIMETEDPVTLMDLVTEVLRQRFPSGAFAYAVLDYAVAFGKYEEGELYIGIGAEKRPASLNWEFLQELRIFDEEKELKLVKVNGSWTGRFRNDAEEVLKQDCVLDQKQKLWGHIVKESGIPGWSILRSERGTVIQIPVEFDKNIGESQEAGLLVRRYIKYPPAFEEQEKEVQKGLGYQEDVRLAGFALWGAEEGEE